MHTLHPVSVFGHEHAASGSQGGIGLRLCLVLLIGVGILCPAAGVALTWDFADGTRQGWSVLGNVYPNGLTGREIPLDNEVVDGVWRITPLAWSASQEADPHRHRSHSLMLISSDIGYDSQLFDTIRIRMRIVHPEARQGSLGLNWTNAANRDYPGRTPPGYPPNSFYVSVHRIQYQPAWHEVVLADIPQAYDIRWQDGVHWQGELVDVRIFIFTAMGSIEQVPENVPALIEIDSITLTGIEEQLLAEPLPLPGAALTVPPPGELFAPAQFQPLTEGLGGRDLGEGTSRAVLLDANANGRLDLVSLWERTVINESGESDHEQGWLLALNDGTGRFTVRKKHNFGDGKSALQRLWAADLTGDGRQELIVWRGRTEVWRITEEYQMQTLLALDNRWLVGVVDGDDGAYLIVALPGTPTAVELWAYTDYGFALVDAFDPDPRLWPFWVTPPVSAGPSAWIWWKPPGFELEHRRWLATDIFGAPTAAFELEDAPASLRFAGDLTGDGALELLTSRPTALTTTPVVYKGLTLWQDWATDRPSAQPWYDETLWLHGRVWAFDLNGNGRIDPVFINQNMSLGGSAAVVVALSRPDGLPQEEGWYPLTGRGGQILAGDVTHDGYPDLVVLDRALGGVHVLRNRLAEEPVTAVGETATARPTGVHLGPNYPNPFNPHTSIPFTLAAVDAVRLQVYDLRGRLVRTLWDGPLAAGPHRLDWDGRNAAGQPVASGVYLYRLEVGGQVHSRKLLKLQ